MIKRDRANAYANAWSMANAQRMEHYFGVIIFPHSCRSLDLPFPLIRKHSQGIKN